jgi:hypothetical protein
MKEIRKVININNQIILEIEKRSSGKLRELAIEILSQLNEDFPSEDRIKDNIRSKVDIIVREKKNEVA